ncbi:hypothetical protein PR048_024714 [Dryococelus australis]|uniref:Uncharacterized protein n=1 Tax=Dryococelus australis TaxID=614101 RepID=A0ABQ9GPF5_9NEOP|nr:hypothetical protein PR048_024714 [Dryococelus australis]
MWEIELSMEQRRNEGVGETRENPPTNGIVRHDSHIRKSSDLAGDRARFMLVGVGRLTTRPPRPLQITGSPLTMDGTSVSATEGESGKPEGVCQIVGCTEKVKDIKLKDLPPVHQYLKKIDSGSSQPSTSKEDGMIAWIVGGSLGSKNTYLQFRCLALSNPPVCSPAHELHMTYKTIQAETKLLAAVLGAHGITEVSNF